MPFFKALLPTPLGDMLAIANEDAIYYLAFDDMPPGKIPLTTTTETVTAPFTGALALLEKSLARYFVGIQDALCEVPIVLVGTPFQREAWKALQQIPYGQTIAYQTQATWLGRQTAYRAVANANGRNPLTLIVPCHRVLRQGGLLGGYRGGLERKQWLIAHEAKQLEMSFET